MIAQMMAAEHPGRVRSLTSIMSNTGDRRHGIISPRVLPKFLSHSPTRETAALDGTMLYQHFAGPAWDFDVHLERARVGVARSYRPKGLLRQLAAIAATGDRSELLAGITAPTLVIHGLADTLVTPSGGIATAKAIPGAQLLMFPDMGHDLPASRWGDKAAAVRSLADRANAGASETMVAG
jgi:pimeloyl-ACP methyl ester carboxylesterase